MISGDPDHGPRGGLVEQYLALERTVLAGHHHLALQSRTNTLFDVLGASVAEKRFDQTARAYPEVCSKPGTSY